MIKLQKGENTMRSAIALALPFVNFKAFTCAEDIAKPAVAGATANSLDPNYDDYKVELPNGMTVFVDPRTDEIDFLG